ncbi:hypothetical protein [Escherichia phage FXie-2024a]
MAKKFVCIKAPIGSKSVQVGDELEGDLIDLEVNGELQPYITITNSGNRMRSNGRGRPYWNIGENVPVVGFLFVWEEVK